MSSTRAYDNRQRQERAQETADRIVAALCELLVEERPATVSIPAVARRAGVSVRTVYSHFPTKEDLFEAIPAHVDRQMRALAADSDIPEDPTDLAGVVRSAVLTLAPLSPLFEATVRAGIDDDARARERNASHIAYFVELLEPRTPGLARRDRARLAALITAIVSHPVIVRMQRSGEGTEGTIDLLTWLVELAVADAARTGHVGRQAGERTPPGRKR